MKQWEDKFRERLEDYEMKLPGTDMQSFWNMKATRERAAKRRRSILSFAVGIPAAAAVIMALVMSINLLSTYGIEQDDAGFDEDYMAFTQENVQWIDVNDIQEFIRDYEDEIFYSVQNPPEFPGGIAALTEYIKKQTVYPTQARNDSIQGRVLVSFIVEKDGSVSNLQVVKGANPLLDAEALRVLSKMPEWSPGTQNDTLCRVQYTVPIRFTL